MYSFVSSFFCGAPPAHFSAGGCDWLAHLPHIRGQGRKPSVPGCNGTGMDERSYQGRHPRGATLHPRPETATERSHPTPEARGSGREEQPHGRGREDQPHVQGVVAAWAQEGLEEPSHVEGQEGRQ